MESNFTNDLDVSIMDSLDLDLGVDLDTILPTSQDTQYVPVFDYYLEDEELINFEEFIHERETDKVKTKDTSTFWTLSSNNLDLCTKRKDSMSSSRCSSNSSTFRKISSEQVVADLKKQLPPRYLTGPQCSPRKSRIHSRTLGSLSPSCTFKFSNVNKLDNQENKKPKIYHSKKEEDYWGSHSTVAKRIALSAITPMRSRPSDLSNLSSSSYLSPTLTSPTSSKETISLPKRFTTPEKPSPCPQTPNNNSLSNEKKYGSPYGPLPPSAFSPMAELAHYQPDQESEDLMTPRRTSKGSCCYFSPVGYSGVSPSVRHGMRENSDKKLPPRYLRGPDTSPHKKRVHSCTFGSARSFAFSPTIKMQDKVKVEKQLDSSPGASHYADEIMS